MATRRPVVTEASAARRPLRIRLLAASPDQLALSRSVFDLRFVGGPEFDSILRTTGASSEAPVFRVSRRLGDDAPWPTQWESTPLGSFAWSGDRLLVRALSGLVALIGADGLGADYFLNVEPDDSTATVVLDEMAAIAMDVRGELCLHAALVVDPNGAGVVLLGDSGTGKSTTAMIAGLHEGWRVASDDAVLILEEQGRPVGYPSYPGVRLRSESYPVATAAGFDLDWSTLPTSRVVDKRRVLPQSGSARVSFADGPIPIDRIVDLRPGSENSRVELTAVDGAAATARLLYSLFSVPLLGAAAAVRRFDQVGRLLDSVRFETAAYPKSIDGARRMLDELASSAGRADGP